MEDSSPILLTGLVALAFSLVHIFGKALSFLQVTPRSIWLSFAGGVSLAYVFVHLLPELARRQEQALRAISADAESPLGIHLYVTALAGLLIFYGLDRLVRRSHATADRAADDAASPRSVFWLHLGSYAIYSVLIGYLLLHREDTEVRGLLIYAIALGLHFIVNDQGLRQYHGDLYDRDARWILAAAPLLGWGAGLLIDLSPLSVGILFALLAGGIVLNVLKEELPEDRESRFWALAAGAAGFAALLLLAR